MDDQPLLKFSPLGIPPHTLRLVRTGNQPVITLRPKLVPLVEVALHIKTFTLIINS